MCSPVAAVACPFALVPLPASSCLLHGTDLCPLVFSVCFHCCLVSILHGSAPDSAVFHCLVLFVPGQYLKYHWQINGS